MKRNTDRPWRVYAMFRDGSSLGPAVVKAETWSDARFVAAMVLAELFPNDTPNFLAQCRRVDELRRQGKPFPTKPTLKSMAELQALKWSPRILVAAATRGES